MIISSLHVKYLDLYSEYEKIYIDNVKTHWADLSIEIENYCNQNCIKYINYFYHEELVKKKLGKSR